MLNKLYSFSLNNDTARIVTSARTAQHNAIDRDAENRVGHRQRYDFHLLLTLEITEIGFRGKWERAVIILTSQSKKHYFLRFSVLHPSYRLSWSIRLCAGVMYAYCVTCHRSRTHFLWVLTPVNSCRPLKTTQSQALKGFIPSLPLLATGEMTPPFFSTVNGQDILAF